MGSQSKNNPVFDQIFGPNNHLVFAIETLILYVGHVKFNFAHERAKHINFILTEDQSSKEILVILDNCSKLSKTIGPISESNPSVAFKISFIGFSTFQITKHN